MYFKMKIPPTLRIKLAEDYSIISFFIMKIPLSWIFQYTDVSPLLAELGAKKLGHLYSIHTAEIDGIEEVGVEDKVVIAKVVSTRPHPDSDHLNLVELDCGPIGKRNIVCGATNVRTAKYVALATV